MRIGAVVLCCLSMVAPVAVADAGQINYANGRLIFRDMITTIRGRKVSLPLNLSYSSRLLKDDLAPWVGLGFDFDMPYIERTIRGAPDDHEGRTKIFHYETFSSDPLKDTLIKIMDTYTPLCPDGIHEPDCHGKFEFDFMTWKKLILDSNKTNYHAYQKEYPHPCWYSDLVEDWEETLAEAIEDQNAEDIEKLYYNLEYLNETYNPQASSIVIDENCPILENQTQADNYRLSNFPGGDRQIYFAVSGDTLVWKTNPYAAWRVEHIYGADGITGWKIIDADGTEYLFDKVLYEKPVEDRQIDKAKITYNTWSDDNKIAYSAVEKFLGPPRWASRWYLSKITSYDGDTIRIEYDESDADHAVRKSPVFTDASIWPTRYVCRLRLDMHITNLDELCTDSVLCPNYAPWCGNVGECPSPYDPDWDLYLVLHSAHLIPKIT